MKFTVMLLSWLVLSGQLCRAAETYRFDSTNSYIEIHLGTSGLLRSAGHDHLIRTAIEKGTFVFDSKTPTRSSVELLVDARRLRVLDPDLSAKDRQKIQATMDSDRVLGVGQFPTITFKSTSVESAGEHQLVLRGNLTIRDKTSGITVQVKLAQQDSVLRATGQSQFNQTQFGIKPVSAGMGTVRVQDLMTIDFVIQGFAQELR